MNDGIVNTYRCKVCGRIKGATNHWILASTQQVFEKVNAMVLIQWDAEVALESDIAFLCGQGCGLILSERWLSHGTFEPPQPNQVLGASTAD